MTHKANQICALGLCGGFGFVCTCILSLNYGTFPAIAVVFIGSLIGLLSDLVLKPHLFDW